jgi:hypothetical protein
MKFDKVVRKTLRSLLNEARQGFLYHYTLAGEPFKDGYFNLSEIFDDAELERSQKYKYFLSCSRIPRGGYNWEMSPKFPHIIFQLDANAISQKYKIIPVNASHTDNGKVAYHSDRHADENEDRIVTNNDKIPFKGNVVSINIFQPNEKYDSEFDASTKKMVLRNKSFVDEMIADAVEVCKRDNISLYLYSDVSALGHLDIRKATKVV